MTASSRSAADAGQLIADALEAADYSYAIGGALALAVAGIPRGTVDVDVNVFVSEEHVRSVAVLLAGLGIALDPDEALARAQRDGMFVGTWDDMRIDVFVPSIPFSWEAERRRIRVSTPEGWSGWFLSAETLVVFKLLFFRGKDIVDLERLIALRGRELDLDYVRRWLVDMMGEDDPRTERWDDIVARFAD